jgi:hypothetical protein
MFMFTSPPSIAASKPKHLGSDADAVNRILILYLFLFFEKCYKSGWRSLVGWVVG